MAAAAAAAEAKAVAVTLAVENKGLRAGRTALDFARLSYFILHTVWRIFFHLLNRDLEPSG